MNMDLNEREYPNNNNKDATKIVIHKLHQINDVICTRLSGMYEYEKLRKTLKTTKFYKKIINIDYSIKQTERRLKFVNKITKNLQSNGFSRAEKILLNKLWTDYNNHKIYEVIIYFPHEKYIERSLKQLEIEFDKHDAHFGIFYYVKFKDLYTVASMIDSNKLQTGLNPKDYNLDFGRIIISNHYPYENIILEQYNI